MFLKYRPAQMADLEECVAYVRDRFAYDAAMRCDLLDFWREGLSRGTLHMLIMEDLDAPPRQRILYFVFKAAMTSDYAARLKTETPPTMGRHVLRLWKQGQSPLLPLDRVRAANSRPHGRALDMMTIHNGSPALWGRGDLAFVMKKMGEWASFSTSGFHIHEYFIEVYGQPEWTWCERGGLLLCRDYAAEGCVPPGIPADKSPRLYTITELQAQASLNTMAAQMFQWQPPRFFFTLPEQELLLWAMGGDTDEEVAGQMSVALITVKKRWEGIYDRVEDAAPGLLSPAESSLAAHKRGSEKKRRLLAYLRHHMEELRPLPPARR